MVKIAVNGASGRMGQMIVSLLAVDASAQLVEALCELGSNAIGKDAFALAGASAATTHVAVSTAHKLTGCVMIDFSLPAGLRERLPECAALKTPLVSGTTGLTPDDHAKLKTLSQTVPVLWAPNFSLGVALLARLSAEAARHLPHYDIEITEAHHRNKRDAPSGTANRLLKAVCEATSRDPSADVRHGRAGDDTLRTKREIGMHAIRGGDVVGDHTVMFLGDGERIELTHKASSRACFAAGAIAAAKWLAHRKPGLYTIEDMLFSKP